MIDNLNKTPLVSVVVPIYNGQEYLESTINSVLSQTYLNWEILLVDNGSTDCTHQIISKYISSDPRIRTISLETNSGGPARPRNIGIEAAKGQYLSFLDADDLWESDKLQLQIDLIMERNVDIVSAGAQVINSMGSKVGIVSNDFRKVKLCRRFVSWEFLLLVFNPICLSSALIRNNFDVRFREDKNFAGIEDWVFWIDNLLCGLKFEMMEENLLLYRSHEASLSDFYGDTQMLKAFHLYSALVVETKLSPIKFMFLTIIRCVRVLASRIFGAITSIWRQERPH